MSDKLSRRPNGQLVMDKQGHRVTDRETWGNNGARKGNVRERAQDGKISGVRNCEVDSFHGVQRSEVE